jgi:hypothetical protein
VVGPDGNGVLPCGGRVSAWCINQRWRGRRTCPHQGHVPLQGHLPGQGSDKRTLGNGELPSNWNSLDIRLSHQGTGSHRLGALGHAQRAVDHTAYHLANLILVRHPNSLHYRSIAQAWIITLPSAKAKLRNQRRVEKLKAARFVTQSLDLLGVTSGLSNARSMKRPVSSP